MDRALRLALAALLALVALETPASAAEAIGTVVRVQNRAVASSSTTGDRVLKTGDAIYLDDLVSTGDQARLEIIFVDRTNLTLGANAAYQMSELSFDGSGGSMTLDVLAGAFAFATGDIGRNNHQDVLVTTPVATIGIRGTLFWGGPIDDAYGVLVLEGAVEVTTPGGSVVLDQAGEGTRIAGQGAVPDAAKLWSEEKKARALATIAFSD
jgi:hypothetical protein